tara:strand:+ start:1758 stop:2489 length:732 start_codon:yes stop_codon:yes gene_type:complete
MKKNNKLNSNLNIRLNKYISNSGICSRREADVFIKAGVVTVNGKSVTKMGAQISETDIVKFNGETISIKKQSYILLNKPKNYYDEIKLNITRKNIYSLIKENKGLFPVDKMKPYYTGLLLLTNDVNLKNKLSNKKKKIKSIYQILIDKELKTEDLQSIRKGVIINNKKIVLKSIQYINIQNKNEIGIEHNNGGIETIIKLLKKFNYQILRLDRVFWAGLTKKNLPRKKYRELTESEVNILKRI